MDREQEGDVRRATKRRRSSSRNPPEESEIDGNPKEKKKSKEKSTKNKVDEGESSAGPLEPDQRKKKKKKRKNTDPQVEGEPVQENPIESEEMRQMRELFERIKDQINDLNTHLLTIADIGSLDHLKASLDEGEVLLSWKNKKPELIFSHTIQENDDCWAHALARALAALMKQHGVTNPSDLPTAEKLIDKIDKSLLSKTNLLRSTIQAAPSILKEYGYELSVHHRPKLNLTKENEDFEKYIERRLAIGPVGMCFPYVEGYKQSNYKDKEVFRPSAADLASMRFEKLDDHCAVITGRGIVLRGGQLIEFWEIQETRGKYFKDAGFTRLERHKGFISEVFEFKRVQEVGGRS